MLSVVLQAYAPAILAIALSRIPFGIAYAEKRSRVVFVYYTAVSISLVVLDWLFVWLGFGLRSFGIAYTFSQSIALIWLYQTIIRDRSERSWSRTDTLQMLSVGLITLAGTAVSSFVVSLWTGSSQWTNWLTLLIGGGSSILLIFLALYLLKLDEFHQLAQLVKNVRR
jgi:peptidoglycan biosynthesis protein MviN/MurJ (putative lipid II flippase)